MKNEERYEIEYVICPACSGTGSGEYWGAYYKCDDCKGTGVISCVVDKETGEIIEELEECLCIY